MTDEVSPEHYKQHPSGIECITITRWMGFLEGNVIKYVWRAGLKTSDPIPDLLKARRYLDWAIENANAKSGVTPQRPGG